jgi:hypothetical protein
MTGPDIAPVDGPFSSKHIAPVDGPFSSKPKSLFQQKEAAVEPPLILDESAKEAAREAVEAEYEARWMNRVQTELGKIVASGLSDARSAKDREHQAAIDKLGAQVEAGIEALEVHQREAEAKLKKKEAEWRARVAEMREAEEGSKQEYRKRAANMSEALREKSKALEASREKSGSSYLESEVKRWRDRALRAEESLRNRGESIGFRRREQTGNKRDRERSPNHERGGRGGEPASKRDYSPAGEKPRSSRSQSSDLTGESGGKGKGGSEGGGPKGESGPDWRTYAERRPAYLLNLKTVVREPSEELLASRKKTAEDKARVSERFKADIEAFDKKERELEEDAERERAGQERRVREQAKAVMVDDSDDQEPMVLTQAQGGTHATRTEKAWDDEVDDDEDWNSAPRPTKEVQDDDDDIRKHGDLPTAARALQAKRGEKGARGTAGLGPDNPQDSPVRELGTTASAAAKPPTESSLSQLLGDGVPAKTAWNRTKTKDLVDAAKEAAAEGGILPGLVSGKSLRKGKVTQAISFVMDLCRSPPGEVVTGTEEDEVDYEEEEEASEGEVNADETDEAPAMVPEEPVAATQVETTEELLARLAAEKKKAGSLKYQKAKMAKAARLAAANPTPAGEELDTSQTSINVFMGTGTAAPGDEDAEEGEEGEEGEESGGDNPGKGA